MRHAAPIAGSISISAVLLTAGVATATTGETPRERSTDTCSLTDADITATSNVDHGRTQLFNDYADSGVGWTGADSTYSVPLKDGSLAWIFSDTFLGPVNDDGTRPESTPFLNNSVVLQDGSDLTTITGGTDDDPASLVGPGPDSDWRWFGAGLRTGPGDLQIGLLEFQSFGDGPWDWAWSGNALATIDTETWDVTSIDALPSESGVQWASWYQRAGEHVYVYGVEDVEDGKYMHVAKVLGGDLTDLERWRYWDGESWQREESSSARVINDVANEYSVTPFRDGYLLVTQDTSVPFNSEIRAYVSCSPTGPFVNPTTLYDMPETGASGSYGNENVYGYNAHEHPELRDGDTVLVTYNVNSLDPADLYDDVTIYRPRFVEIALDVQKH
ncbi:DUF4185 domain-containing protein [Actinobacteria bacterium YIM 96077]|uniref:DUF4185 domain-containing protein n=1 Tax=Phytoactinopolyspora halophila TaxID=1981511 RepID=A0A329QAT2_9ACTN|nr:DUF4185 domain-containing protein [Phytoactinopolyspora halophila]AYY13721.1 DUF4185 domain-containing protein [Actinobacteria bacterium YIM 96077]RAW09347.1 DUF4185 domain-containing protein [Phytoactinopolyspora halophila]